MGGGIYWTLMVKNHHQRGREHQQGGTMHYSSNRQPVTLYNPQRAAGGMLGVVVSQRLENHCTIDYGRGNSCTNLTLSDVSTQSGPQRSYTHIDPLPPQLSACSEQIISPRRPPVCVSRVMGLLQEL